MLTKPVALRERNVGIELFRIVSMMMVLVLHILGKGGVLSAVDAGGGTTYGMAWAMEIAAYGAVNCFALISGYVGWRSAFRPSKLLELWFHIIYISVFWTVLFYFISPERITFNLLSTVFIPINAQEYWYMSAYFGLFLLSPALNAAIANMEKRVFSVMLILIALMFSVLTTPLNNSAYTLNDGYSTIWLCVVYLFGGYFSRFDIPERISKRASLGFYLLMTGCTIGVQHFLHYFKIDITNVLIRYTAFPIFFASLGLLAFFARVEIKSAKLKSVIYALAKCSLGVYLLHQYPVIWDCYLKNLFVPYASFGSLMLVAAVLLTSVVVYLVCAVFEELRMFLFRVTGFNQFLKKADKIMINSPRN